MAAPAAAQFRVFALDRPRVNGDGSCQWGRFLLTRPFGRCMMISDYNGGGGYGTTAPTAERFRVFALDHPRNRKADPVRNAGGLSVLPVDPEAIQPRNICICARLLSDGESRSSSCPGR